MSCTETIKLWAYFTGHQPLRVSANPASLWFSISPSPAAPLNDAAVMTLWFFFFPLLFFLFLWVMIGNGRNDEVTMCGNTTAAPAYKGPVGQGNGRKPVITILLLFYDLMNLGFGYDAAV